MSEEELKVIRLKNDFYRDGFRKVLFSLGVIIVAIFAIIATSVYLYLTKPKPINFPVYADWRILLAVPEKQPYLTEADLGQWVSNTLQEIFVFNFYQYNMQLEQHKKFFTDKGKQIYVDFLNNYASEKTVTETKIFVLAKAEEAPLIRDKGELPDGRYAWLVDMKLKITYSGALREDAEKNVSLTALVVRVPNINNITGVAIEDIRLHSQGRAS